MGTATIVSTNLESQAQANILAYVDNRVYVKDPRSPNSTQINRVFVYETDPFEKAINFSDFPYIVLNLPLIESSIPSSSGKHRKVNWSHRVVVRAVRDGSANTRSDVGKSDIMAIGDDLNALFHNMAVKKELQALNIFDIELKKVNMDNFLVHQKPVYEAEYELTYWSRLATSS